MIDDSVLVSIQIGLINIHTYFNYLLNFVSIVAL